MNPKVFFSEVDLREFQEIYPTLVSTLCITVSPTRSFSLRLNTHLDIRVRIVVNQIPESVVQ